MVAADKTGTHQLRLYEWPEDSQSVVTRIDFRADGKVGYIYASENAGNLFALRELLKKQGWILSPDLRNGVPVLRVSGMHNEKELISFLAQGNYVTGTPEVTEPNIEKKKLGQSLRQNTLRASGLSYMLGDALYFINGIQKNLYSQAGVGAAFATGDIALAVFNKKDEATQLKELLRKLERDLKKHGIQIPDSSALNVEAMTRSDGFLERIYDFMHEHVNVIRILAELVGAGLMIKAGFDRNDTSDKIAGAAIMTGWTAALLIKEKKVDKRSDEYRRANIFQKFVMTVRSRPLSLAATGSLVNNAFVIKGAFDERRGSIDRTGQYAGKNYYLTKLAGVAGMLVGNSLLLVSKKDGGKLERARVVADVFGLSAQLLDSMPENIREAAIKQTVEFLSTREEISDSKAEIEARLRKKMADILSNPWYEQGTVLSGRTPPPNSPGMGR